MNLIWKTIDLFMYAIFYSIRLSLALPRMNAEYEKVL